MWIEVILGQRIVTFSNILWISERTCCDFLQREGNFFGPIFWHHLHKGAPFKQWFQVRVNAHVCKKKKIKGQNIFARKFSSRKTMRISHYPSSLILYSHRLMIFYLSKKNRNRNFTKVMLWSTQSLVSF